MGSLSLEIVKVLQSFEFKSAIVVIIYFENKFADVTYDDASSSKRSLGKGELIQVNFLYCYLTEI